MTAATLHPRLQDIADEFNAIAGADRLQLLLEFSQDLPPLPGRYAEHPGLLEPVPECQSPLFLAVEMDQDATFRTRAELEAIYQGEAGLRPDDDVVVYCRIGERSSHTWFVLHHLLGYPHVRNYDGSWTEWGNSVRVPITRGESP